MDRWFRWRILVHIAEAIAILLDYYSVLPLLCQKGYLTGGPCKVRKIMAGIESTKAFVLSVHPYWIKATACIPAGSQPDLLLNSWGPCRVLNGYGETVCIFGREEAFCALHIHTNKCRATFITPFYSVHSYLQGGNSVAKPKWNLLSQSAPLGSKMGCDLGPGELDLLVSVDLSVWTLLTMVIPP